MTTPTQAQIEAAAKAMMFPTIAKPSGYWLNKAEAALTAAAQVGDDTISDLTTGGKPTAQVGDDTISDLTTGGKPTAQVGEQEKANNDMALFGRGFTKQHADGTIERVDPATVFISEIDATIERCAQVAEAYDMDGDLKDGLPKGWEGCRRMIATAIRKLKDEA